LEGRETSDTPHRVHRVARQRRQSGLHGERSRRPDDRRRREADVPDLEDDDPVLLLDLTAARRATNRRLTLALPSEAPCALTTGPPHTPGRSPSPPDSCSASSSRAPAWGADTWSTEGTRSRPT